MKVFVIEDNPVYNDYVCNLLKKDSFDTMSAYNLATAKKLLAKSEVDDIVVADLRLPDGESIELLRWMRANDKQQVFIVMTNYGEVPYGSGKYEARLKGLHTETVVGG